MAPYERWAGVGNVAAHLDIGEDFIYRWVKSRGLPARMAGRLLRFKLSQVDAWVEAAGGGPTGEIGHPSTLQIPRVGSKANGEQRTRPVRRGMRCEREHHDR